VIGPAVGGWLGNRNLRFPFWAAAALSLGNALYGYFVLPESLPPERRAKSAWHMAHPFGSFELLRSHRELAGLSVVVTLYYLAHNSLPSMWALYTEYRYAWSRRDVGNSLALVGVCAAIISGALVGPYVKRFGERRSVLSGLFFGTVGFAGFAFATRGWMVLAVIPFIALWGIAAPAVQSLMARHVDPSSQGKLQGAINSLRAITGMAGPVLFTQVFTLAISARYSLHLPGAPYYLAAVLLGASDRGYGRDAGLPFTYARWDLGARASLVKDFHPLRVELGYSAVRTRRVVNPLPDPADLLESEVADKAYVSIEWYPRRNIYLRFLISHQVASGSFAGMNGMFGAIF